MLTQVFVSSSAFRSFARLLCTLLNTIKVISVIITENEKEKGKQAFRLYMREQDEENETHLRF